MNVNIPPPSRTESSLTQRKSPSVVHLSAKKELLTASSPFYAENKLIVAPPLGLSRSYSTRPLGRTLLVKAEFVFADPGAKQSVSVHGDWNDWTGVLLNKEETDLWSCVSIVPTGLREFYFVVDGSLTLSSRHPVSICGTKNWRNVHGPRRTEPKTNSRTAFYRWAQQRLEGLGLAVAPGEMDNALIGVIGEMEQPATARRRDGVWDKLKEFGWGTLVVLAISLYLVGAALHSLLLGE